MKKLLFYSLAFCFSFKLLAQSYKGMSYQAIIRGSNNELIVESPVGAKISIKIMNEIVFSEYHRVLTNENGLITLEIGAGEVLEGDFLEIDWSASEHFLIVSVDPNGGNNYTIVSESKLNAVPFAYQAGNVEILNSGEEFGQMNYWNGNQWIPFKKGNPGQILIISSDGKPTWSGDTYPIVRTESVNNIKSTSAKIRSNVLTAGGRNITGRGIVFGLKPNPGLSDNIITTSNGLGAYEIEMKNLKADSTYFVRAFASNSLGTGFGNELEFKTPPATTPNVSTTNATNITQISAVLGGTILDDGGSPIIEKGIFWGSEENINPKNANKKIIEDLTGSFSLILENLEPNKNYYFLAYAVNERGFSYGTEKKFTTKELNVPILTTREIINITNMNASCGGIIESNGGTSIKSKGIVWATSPNPTIEDNKTNEGVGENDFTSILTALSPNTTYYVRAYAENSTGLGYGQQVSFKTRTESGTLAVVETRYATDISAGFATLNGALLNEGGSAVTNLGIIISEEKNPTLGNNSIFQIEPKISSFSIVYNELKNNTTYYFRAFAINSYGISFGEILQFKTKSIESPLVKLDFTYLSSNGLTGLVRFIDDGNSPVLEMGLVASKNPHPTINDILLKSKENDKGAGTEETLTGLESGSTYYVRAYAKNSIGIRYSLEEDTVLFEKIEKLIDIDNNTYHVVKIGDQYWMQENLKVTRFNDGTVVPYLLENELWVSTREPAWCNLNHDSKITDSLGAIYNGYTAIATNKNICPNGWSVPDMDKVNKLLEFLGGDLLAGPKLRSRNSRPYYMPSNESGFNGKEIGLRYDGSGLFSSNGGYWWTSTKFNIQTRFFSIWDGSIGVASRAWYNNGGVSIRCIKN